MSNRGRLFIISAPSGSGKTSLAIRLLEEVSNLQFAVSHTTRRPRGQERHGVEYFFVSETEFETMIVEEAFLEHAHVYGNYYGTNLAFVESQLSSGTDVLLDIDVQGALKVKARRPETVLIFVFPPSFDELRSRLKRRSLDDQKVIEKRLNIAREEIQLYKEYGYLIVNSEIGKSLNELKSIIMAARGEPVKEDDRITAEYCEVENQIERAEKIILTFQERN
jgi:guanylate kinase